MRLATVRSRLLVGLLALLATSAVAATLALRATWDVGETSTALAGLADRGRRLARVGGLTREYYLHQAHMALGMAHGVHEGRMRSARSGLEKALHAARDVPLVPEARAYLAQVDALVEDAFLPALKAGRMDAARGAYSSCTKAAPGFAAHPWMVLADHRATLSGQGLGEADALAMAIAAEPHLALELDARLRDATARGMAESGRSLGLIRTQLADTGRYYPEGQAGVVLLLALARTHLEANDPDAAAVTARRLLRDLPGFVPALDTLGLAYLIQGRHEERFEVLLQVAESAGPQPVTLAALEDTRDSLDDLPADLLVRWMTVDPDFTGSMELARGLARQGRPQAALGGMVGLSRELFDDRDRLLYAELLLEIDQHEGMLTAVEPISDEGPFAVRSALLQLLAGTALGRAEVLEAAMDQLEARLDQLLEAPDEDLVQRCLDTLLDAQLGPAVLRFTRLLAETPRTRSGRRMGQAAMAELLYGDPDEAASWLDRAEAFVEDGSPLVGRLALALAADDDEARIDLARELRTLAPDWARPHHAALLAGLEGRRGEAETLAAEALAEPLPDPRAHLVAAAVASLSGLPPASPDALAPELGPEAGQALATLAALPDAAGRRVLLLLLALDCPDWEAWGLARLSLPTNRLVLGPFATMLAIDHAVDGDDLKTARALLAQGRKRWPGFLPFWDQAEDLALARLGRSDHPELATLRRLRRQAGVAPRDGIEPTPAEMVMDLGLEAGAEGRTDEALTRARAAVDLAPDDLAPRYLLARTAQASSPAEAAEAWYGLLASDPPIDGDLAAEARTGLVAALDRLDATALPTAQLTSLVVRYPDSALLAVLMAERMAAELGGSAAGLPGLLELMDGFLDSHEDVVLDELEQGAARRWFELLEAYDPERALAFALGQRDLAPRRLEGWTLVALGLEATGQRREALEAWRQLARMTTTPEVTIEAASWVAELGGSHEEVNELLLEAKRMAKAADLVAWVEFVRARSLANIGRDYLTPAIDIFEALQAAEVTPGLERSELVARLGITYLHRGNDDDGAKAEPLLREAAAATTDPLRRDLLTALANMAPRLDRLRKERQLTDAEALGDG